MTVKQLIERLKELNPEHECVGDVFLLRIGNLYILTDTDPPEDFERWRGELSKKDYKAIAEIIAKENKPKHFENSYCKGKEDVLIYMVNELANYFAQGNPAFNREKFGTACGF